MFFLRFYGYQIIIMKRNLLIALVVIVFMSIVFFSFKTFILTINNQRNCEFANIDNIEINVGINIPSVESSNCNYDEVKNEKSVYFKFDKDVNINEYCSLNKFSKLKTSNLEDYLDLNYTGNNNPFKKGIDNFYSKSEARYSNNYHAILNAKTKELWIVISFKD